MDKEKYYKYLFYIGAIWNWIVAISLLFASLLFLDLIANFFGILIPPSLIWFHIVVGIIFLFGIGYYIVAKDLTKNRGVVILGSIEKFLFFGVILLYYLLGDVNIFAILLVAVDFIFGCLYFEFLVNKGQSTG
ncbi:MAG: hypothetical protein ACFFD2_29740 [Promethearchaeota archaeon]